MYWNRWKHLFDRCNIRINRNMRGIEIWPWNRLYRFWIAINRNMRCIEIGVNCQYALWHPRLIETWDVLKLTLSVPPPFESMINRNMRCIEISDLLRLLRSCYQINRNMRCIEMCFSAHKQTAVPRLIETWDVLKLFYLL